LLDLDLVQQKGADLAGTVAHLAEAAERLNY
jgi:hypothetical protein